MPDQVRAGVYLRMSRDRKAADGAYTMLGVERQREDCLALCTQLGWEVADVFVDNDVSATSKKPRPSFQKLLAAIRAGDIDAIVCWHPDRLYRKVQDLEEIVEVCNKAKAPIATVNAGHVDLTTPTGRLVAGLLAQVARFEGEHKAERWRRSYVQKRQKGQPFNSGPRPFGYTRDGQVIPAEAEALRWACGQLLQGATQNQVLAGLYNSGVRSTRGNPISAAALRLLLTNPRNAGWVHVNGDLVARSTWPSILSEEEWEGIKALYVARKKGPRAPRVAILVGIIHCGVCGARMQTGSRDKSHGGWRTYVCAGDGRCVSTKAVPVEQMAEGYAKQRLSDPRIVAELSQLAGDSTGAIAREIASLEQRLAELEAELSNNEGVPVAQVFRAMESLRARIEEGQARLGAVVPRVSVNAEWPTDVAGRHAMVGLAIEKVWVDKTPVHLRGSKTFHPSRVRIDPR